MMFVLEGGRRVELRDYVRVLRRSWMLVLAFVVLGGLLAAGATWRSTKEYAASVTMVVSSPDNAEGAASAYQGGLLSQQRVKSYANLVASDRVASAVIHRLHLRTTPDQLRGQVTAQAVPDTVLLRATVRDQDPRQATSIANAVGEEFSDAVAMIERPADDGPPSVRVNVWERAKLPTSPVVPQPTRNMALGLLLGLVLGITAALVRFRLDTSISGRDDARDITDLPNLALINYDSDSARRPLITSARPHTARAEAFRQLRTNLQFVDVDAGPRSILISSSVPGEGKTTTVCNLAISLAQGGHRVCLIEGDLRRPSFSGYLGVESAAGLTSVLIGAADLDDVLQPWGEGRVGAGKIEVLASGPVPPNPSELLGSQNMADLIDLLHTRFDFVLLDAPPLLPVTDAAVLATRADVVLLVARVGRTRREQLRRATEALRAVDAKIVGTVLNMVPTKGPDAYYYGQYSSYIPRGRHARADSVRSFRIPAPDAGMRPAGPATSTDSGITGASATGAGATVSRDGKRIEATGSPTAGDGREHRTGPGGRGTAEVPAAREPADAEPGRRRADGRRGRSAPRADADPAGASSEHGAIHAQAHATERVAGTGTASGGQDATRGPSGR